MAGSDVSKASTLPFMLSLWPSNSYFRQAISAMLGMPGTLLAELDLLQTKHLALGPVVPGAHGAAPVIAQGTR